MIKFVRVTLVLIDLGRHRVSCSAYSKSLAILDTLGMSEIDHRYSTRSVDHEIRSLNVTIEKTPLMDIFEDETYLYYYEKGEGRVKGACHLK